MKTKFRYVAVLVAVAGLLVSGIAIADPAKNAKSDAKKGTDAKGSAATDSAELEFKLPPGWTKADMEACMLAGTPGKSQQRLVAEAGEWAGKTTMWMMPDSPPVTSECSATITPIMDGRFTLTEMNGEMPGMGPYIGQGLQGYDNVSQKFVSTWIDNHSTGIMNGEGKLSADGKTLTWTFTFNCPLTQKPATMRQVETLTGSKTKTLIMYNTDPKSGKEYKMMNVELTKK
jgi:hypothetical protein